jgi:hypothetical protein
MATQAEAVDWLNSTLGQHLDYDGAFGQQCVDNFNFYYKWLTGRNPYNDGLSSPNVNGAKDLWVHRIGDFTYIPDSADLVPQPGDILIYGAAWGHGNGHVESVLSTDDNGCWVIGENMHGNPNEGVVKLYRTYAQMRGLLGVMRYHWPPGAPPYTISAMEPKRMVVAANHYKWNLAQPNFDAIVANPITESGSGVEFTATAVLTRPDLPNYRWYLEDTNTPHGWNTLDCSDYVAPAPLPAPAAPYVPPAAPITAPPAKKYKLLTTVKYYGNSSDAQFDKNPISTLAAKEYYEFERGSSTVQLGDDNMTPKYWVNTKDNVAPIPVKVIPSTDAWKATAQWFYPGNRNKFDLYELQNDVVVVDLDNKGQKFTIYANKAQQPDDPEQSDNRLLKVYGTVYKESVKYYILHDIADTEWIYWYVVPVINRATGKSFLLKYSEVYDTTPKDNDPSPGEEALAALVNLGYLVWDIVSPKRIIAVIKNKRRNN